jgi:sulfur-carrier protein
LAIDSLPSAIPNYQLPITNYQLPITNYQLPSMSVKVLIPTPLQNLTNNQAQLECSASSVDELIQALEESCPGIKARLCDDQGKPRRFLNFYVNSEDIRFLDGTNTPLQDGDEVSIVPAVAGG